MENKKDIREIWAETKLLSHFSKNAQMRYYIISMSFHNNIIKWWIDRTIVKWWIDRKAIIFS